MVDTDAKRIAQEFLDRQGAATVAGDVDATLAFCSLPCVLESPEGRVLATTEDEMRAICATFIDGLRMKRVTHMVRRCLEAEFQDRDTLLVAYETRLVSEGQFLSEAPYAGFVVLRRRGNDWKISSMQFAVEGSNPAVTTLRRWADQRARADRDDR
jgi:hypothetical protein